VLVSGTRLFQMAALHASGPVPFSIGVPPISRALIDLPLFTQGLCTGAPAPQLSNALDVIVGR
jgi:hypothetical protein